MTDVWDAVDTGDFSWLHNAINERMHVNCLKSSTPTEDKTTPIQRLVEKVLQNGLTANPNKPEQVIQTLMMRVFLEGYPDKEILDKNGRTPLLALVCGISPDTPDRPHRFRLIAILLKDKVNANSVGICRRNAMQFPAGINWIHLIRILLAYGVDVDTTLDGSERTPLMIAAGMNNMRAVRMLLTNGASIRAGTTSGIHAVRLANNSRHTDMVRYLKRVREEQKRAEQIVHQEIREEKRIEILNPLAIGYAADDDHRHPNKKSRMSSLNNDVMRMVIENM